MKRKMIQVDAKLHRLIQEEAYRQSVKKDCVVTMGGVIAQLAAKLGKKRGK